MNNQIKLLLALTLMVFIKNAALAQGPAADLIKQGVDLNNQHKYTEAIDKFTEAIKAEPENGFANYQLAYSLYNAKRGKEGIPYLEKVIGLGSTSYQIPAYCLLAGIYDENKESKKAIDTYNLAIAIKPDYPQIYYNLGLAYSRNQQYAEAEIAAIEAIKHDPKSASNQRLYALAAFHQNKRANALMGLCGFLLVEPTGARAAEAYGNIQHIIQGGVLKGAYNNTTVPLSAKSGQELMAQNTSISLVVASAQIKKLAGTDLLEYELKNIFIIFGESAQKKADKSFFDDFYADYLYKLAQSDNIAAFTRTISQSVNVQESSKWLKDNAQKVHDLQEWIDKTERGF